MSGPFKMKGNPMKRNFGIGTSPMKDNGKMEKIPSKKAKHVPVSESGKETVAQNAAEARGESYSWNPKQAPEKSAKEDKKSFEDESAKKAMKKR